MKFHPDCVAGVDLRLGDPRLFAAISSIQGGPVPFRVPGKARQRNGERFAHGLKLAAKAVKIIQYPLIPIRVDVIVCSQGISRRRPNLPVGDRVQKS